LRAGRASSNPEQRPVLLLLLQLLRLPLLLPLPLPLLWKLLAPRLPLDVCHADSGQCFRRGGPLGAANSMADRLVGPA
jgi:hypothetical protein